MEWAEEYADPEHPDTVNAMDEITETVNLQPKQGINCFIYFFIVSVEQTFTAR